MDLGKYIGKKKKKLKVSFFPCVWIILGSLPGLHSPEHGSLFIAQILFNLGFESLVPGTWIAGYRAFLVTMV